MKKVEAPTLEEAYEKAATQLACSVTDLAYEVIQYPSAGILGFLKKNAVIVATCKRVPPDSQDTSAPESKTFESIEENVASEIIAAVTTKDEPSPVQKEKDAVLDSFFDADNEEETEVCEEESVIYDELARLIEDELKELFSYACFAIDVVEVDVVDNTALIFIDGDDAALLIGKEGYRYNALSYMLFNWLHTKYELFIKLEIAEFLTSQQEMIRNYIKPVIENVEKNGRGKTRSLDGILVQIALEQLREAFPNKYVAIKTGKAGNKFVVINEFNNKSHA
ncbi:Jag N-terminal domain-containing protein [Sulfurovum sp.]|uniref:Jag N-terminal domain-containing protein n=1 Tax=Sulfurovum sp. TaxID=1969726 RepID=UPI0025CE93C3|nr:Jag N-terminal domain-containing protein [Sulfurovum sp.]